MYRCFAIISQATAVVDELQVLPIRKHEVPAEDFPLTAVQRGSPPFRDGLVTAVDSLSVPGINLTRLANFGR